MGFSVARAQDATGYGSIAGTVMDEWHAVPLAGVAVSVRGTTLAVVTGIDGRFLIEQVPAGDRVVAFSKAGYARAIVTEVRVGPGQSSTVNLQLRPEFYEMEEYEVTAEELGDQRAEILFERQASSTLVDAIGSEQFSNLAVSDAAQVLSKVTGATVADGKYAVVRGLADRYTFTTMNGMDLPSADPDRKAFQLDLFPAKFIEQVDVRKTFSPDMHGGFAGGSVDIVTKSYPEDFLFEFRLGTAYNTQSSLRDDFAATDRGSTDWLGMDDGTRELPDAAAATPPFGTASPLDPAIKGTFNSTHFAPIPVNSPLDSAMSLLFGNTHEVLGKRLGYLAGLEYKNEYRFYDDGEVRKYEGAGTTTSIDKTDTRGLIEYNWAALANLALELSEQHELKFNFLFVQAAEDEARRLQGQDDVLSTEPGVSYVDQSILRWTERNLTYYQLAGGHEFPELNEVRFDWGAALSSTTQDDPDYRIFQFLARPPDDFNPNGPTTPSRPTRFWRELEEDNMNLRADFTVPLPSYNSRDNRIKTGVAYSASNRDYAQRGFDVRSVPQHPFYSTGDPNIFLIEENHPYIAYHNFIANITYDGEQTINAGYLMADWGALDWLELSGGVRFESTDLTVDAFDLSRNVPLAPGAIDQDDWLPSVSAKFHLRENVDLRAAWSGTVVRPTYREIAAVPIYDVARSRVYIGNPELGMAASDNFDLRASWYPRAGEILSASVFAKRIQDPIEQLSITRDNSRVTYENFDEAEVYGVEAELRVGLDRVWEPLKPLNLGVNAAYITSEVPLTETQRTLRQQRLGDNSTHRPLYDQPDYILNADLTWTIEETGTSITLSGGVVGERLVLVSLATPDEFLAPAPELNLFIRQKLGQHWDVRFTAKNLLDPAQEVTQTWPEAGEVVLRSYRKGITFGLSVGCEF
jgi:outer membrane receptor protein involved in Fe transport